MNRFALSNGNGSLLQGNRHYISYTYPDQNWLTMLPRQMRASLCVLSPRGWRQRCRPSFQPWIAPMECDGLKHFNVLRTESDQATCPRLPIPENGKETLTEAMWRIVEATGNTHLGILTTAVQQGSELQVRFHFRRVTAFVDDSVECVEYHYSFLTFTTIMYQFMEANFEIGRRDPAAKQWFVNLLDLIWQTTDRAYLAVMETSCRLVEHCPDAEFFLAGPKYHFLDEGVVDYALKHVGIDLIEEEGGVGPDRTCAICTELMRVDQKNNHFAVRLSCGHIFGVECIRRWLEYPIGGLTSCPMCRKYIYIPCYADYYDEDVPDNQPWDHLEFRLRTIDEIFVRGNAPQQMKITEPAMFILALQYLIGVQLHANPTALPPHYNPATYPETKSMVTAICDDIDDRKESCDFLSLFYALCTLVVKQVGADNGITWDRYHWIINSVGQEWLYWASKTIKRALWMTLAWTLDDWPLTNAYHCLEIKRKVNLRYPRLQEKMEELSPSFAEGAGSLAQGCGPLGFE